MQVSCKNQESRQEIDSRDQDIVFLDLKKSRQDKNVEFLSWLVSNPSLIKAKRAWGFEERLRTGKGSRWARRCLEEVERREITGEGI